MASTLQKKKKLGKLKNSSQLIALDFFNFEAKSKSYVFKKKLAQLTILFSDNLTFISFQTIFFFTILVRSSYWVPPIYFA